METQGQKNIAAATDLLAIILSSTKTDKEEIVEILNDYLEGAKLNLDMDSAKSGALTKIEEPHIDKYGDLRYNKFTELSGVHFNHCFQGEYIDSCKYGDENCPAKPIEEDIEKLIYGCFGEDEWKKVHPNAKLALIDVFKATKQSNKKYKYLGYDIPTAEEFLKSDTCDNLSDAQRAIEFAKLHAQAALEKAKDEVAKDRLSYSGLDIDTEDRILNAYPLTNIK